MTAPEARSGAPAAGETSPGAARPAEVLVAVERAVLGAGPRYTPAQLWTLTGVPEKLARALWLAMGFPHLPDDEATLAEADMAALARARDLLDSGSFDPAQMVHQTRVMSQSLATIAAAHVETFERRGGISGRFAGLEDDPVAFVPVLDEVLVYLYHRHLLAALERATLVPEPTGSTLPVTVVGFADLSDFSATAARSSDAELTLLVDGFASVAADLVANAGGRVVKLIGDEVMFAVEDPARAAALALDLVMSRGDPDSPPVHVGLALGPVLGHHGDLFGSTVNVASRLADVARPGTVLVNAALAEALRGRSDVDLHRVGLRPLKGVGQVNASVLRRPHSS